MSSFRIGFPPRRELLDGVPVPKPPGQAGPFAALLGDVEDRVQDLQIVERDVAAWYRQASLDVTILSLGEFHVRNIACT